MKKEYEMTEKQLAKIIEASKPVTYIVVGGVPQMWRLLRGTLLSPLASLRFKSVT